MNKVILTGRWSKDIDFKALDSGKNLAKSSIAVDDGYGDKKQTYFFDVEIWGKTAEAVANYSGKGKKIMIEGRLKVDTWEKDGQKQYRTKVVAEQVEFLEHKDSGSSSNTGPDPSDNDAPPDYDPDDLPF
jgi:single-strand DNA-binding protein